MAKKIGIIGPRESPEVGLLAKRIGELSAEPVVCDFANFPYSRCITVESKSGHQAMNLSLPCTRIGTGRMHGSWQAMSAVIDGIDLFEISAFYIRQPGWMWPIPQQKLSKEEWMKFYDHFVNYITDERESLSLKYSLLNILDNSSLVINPYRSFFYHGMKSFQFDTLEGKGLPVPQYLCSNDLEELKSFVHAQSGGAVLKPMSGGEEVVEATLDLLERDKAVLNKKPWMVQRLIKGKNIRAFVLGEEFIGAAHIIHGEEIDSRAKTQAVKMIDISEQAKKICIEAAKSVDMIFSGVDLQYSDKEDKYYILECNPSPLFYNFEHLTGIEVSKKLAKFLVENGK